MLLPRKIESNSRSDNFKDDQPTIHVKIHSEVQQLTPARGNNLLQRLEYCCHFQNPSLVGGIRISLLECRRQGTWNQYSLWWQFVTGDEHHLWWKVPVVVPRVHSTVFWLVEWILPKHGGIGSPLTDSARELIRG